MVSKQTNKSDVFWADDPEQKNFTFAGQNKYLKQIFQLPIILNSIITWLLPAVILAFFNPLLAMLWFVFLAYVLGLIVYRLNKMKSLHRNALETQERARLTTAASTIGSAIHVAGHPLLERDQPVVLVLIDDHLSIYKYDSSQPVDTILLNDISSIQTVVYDDERVPHIEVIDSAAQALQFSITKQGQLVTFLFRSMLKVRPIDWYHAIEKARFAIRTV